jgi:hypothetical protein
MRSGLPLLERINSADSSLRFLFGFFSAFGSPRVIAMGLPSTNLEGLYRNPITEVARFFNTQHKDHYLILNLCSERTYPSEPFHGRVVRFPFDDHGPAPVSTMLQFCVYVYNFLEQDKDNIVAIHCKGGKGQLTGQTRTFFLDGLPRAHCFSLCVPPPLLPGRTGSFVSAWLLFSNPHLYAEQALKTFATFRTSQEAGGRLQGVSGPSQKRYIGYFEQLRTLIHGKPNVLAEGLSHLRNTPPAELVSLTLNHVAPVDAAKEMQRGGEKARDVHNSQWNKSRNWSLLITYYAPIATYDTSEQLAQATAAAADADAELHAGTAHPSNVSSSSSLPSLPVPLDLSVEKPEDPDHWTADVINRRNMVRYGDTKEFYFPAREKQMVGGEGGAGGGREGACESNVEC